MSILLDQKTKEIGQKNLEILFLFSKDGIYELNTQSMM